MRRSRVNPTGSADLPEPTTDGSAPGTTPRPSDPPGTAHHPDLQGRLTAGLAHLVMSELPSSALDHPATPVTDLAELAASAICASYRLGPATALNVTEHVLGHLGSYFAVPEAHHAPASQRELPLVHRVSFLDQLEPHARSTLLYRIAADFDPTGLRGTVRSALAQDERLYGAVDRAIRHVLRRYAGVHTFHHNDPRKTANFHDVVEEVMIQLRRNLNPIISDAIVAQTFVSDHRRRQQPT